jgi:shikimate dehydrogenase
MVGEMFDGVGLLAAARAAGIEPQGKRVLLVGAGGAGRAIAFAMAAEGVADLAIANRTPDRAEALVRDLLRVLPKAPARAAPADGSGFDLIVNCTSLGLHAGDPMPLDPATLRAPTAFIDIIAVRDTEIMQAARDRGCPVVGGRPMAELQIDAQLAFLGARG